MCDIKFWKFRKTDSYVVKPQPTINRFNICLKRFQRFKQSIEISLSFGVQSIPQKSYHIMF